jgi:Fe-Mn family superoxide dismutase
MSDIKSLLDLADELDEKGLETEADLVEEYLRKTARKGVHKCGLREDTVTRHQELLEGYEKALGGFRKQYKKLLLSNNEKDSSNDGPLRETLRGIAHNENAVQLHNMYFEDVIDCKPYEIDRTKFLWNEIKERYIGTRNKFKQDLKRVAKTPRCGWVLINYCTLTGGIYLDIVDLHEVGHVATSLPIACVDMWEHAYFSDFGLDKEEYLDWFLGRMDWRKPEKRLKNYIRLRRKDA